MGNRDCSPARSRADDRTNDRRIRRLTGRDLEVGGLIVRDVDAMVLPDAALSENLLGLSFLSRLKRFEYSNGQMVLEQ